MEPAREEPAREGPAREDPIIVYIDNNPNVIRLNINEHHHVPQPMHQDQNNNESELDNIKFKITKKYIKLVCQYFTGLISGILIGNNIEKNMIVTYIIIALYLSLLIFEYFIRDRIIRFCIKRKKIC
jgi:hypothetical protein